MSSKIGNIGIDCNEVKPMVDFWNAVLDYEAKHLADDNALLWAKDRRGPRIFIQQVPEPHVGKNRLHIDLYTTDAEAEAQRIEGIGATRVKRFEDEDDLWIILGDPDGNLFCVCQADQPTIELI